MTSWPGIQPWARRAARTASAWLVEILGAVAAPPARTPALGLFVRPTVPAIGLKPLHPATPNSRANFFATASCWHKPSRFEPAEHAANANLFYCEIAPGRTPEKACSTGITGSCSTRPAGSKPCDTGSPVPATCFPRGDACASINCSQICRMLR